MHFIIDRSQFIEDIGPRPAQPWSAV